MRKFYKIDTACNIAKFHDKLNALGINVITIRGGGEDKDHQALTSEVEVEQLATDDYATQIQNSIIAIQSEKSIDDNNSLIVKSAIDKLEKGNDFTALTKDERIKLILHLAKK